MKNFACFCGLSFFLILMASSAHAVTCKATSKSVAQGNACSQLGETRMLSDHSGIVACLIVDTSQTGQKQNCEWSSMAGGSSGVLSGTMCGVMSVSSSTISGTSGNDAREYSYTDCSYALTLSCGGNPIALVRETAATGYTRVCKSSSSGLNHLGYRGTIIARNLNDVYALPNCPSGYTFSKVMSGYYSCVKD